MPVMFNRVLIAGLGLIGGCIARDLRRLQLAEFIAAYDSDAAQLEAALADGSIDLGAASIAALGADYDLLVLATPISASPELARDLAAVLSPEAIVMDVGSCKRHFLQRVRELAPELNVVGAHPLAGVEFSGYAAARAQFFAGQRVVITPDSQSSAQAVLRVANMWRALGAELLFMSPEWHDNILAKTSHLPHLLSFALYESLSASLSSSALRLFSGGGLRDFTRIAASDTKMWSDIFLLNKDQLLQDLGAVQNLLADYRALISTGDRVGLTAKLRHVRSQRSWLNSAGSLDMLCAPTSSLRGQCQVPGDKSISHRALLFAAIADGRSHISDMLEGEDNLATLGALSAMGVQMLFAGDGSLQVDGVGLRGLQPAQSTLDLGNSGTAARLFSGLLAAQNFSSTISGDESLNSRPMARVFKPLQAMGARFRASSGDTLPAEILATPQGLQGIDFAMDIPSAQVKSAVMIASLYATGESSITECGITRDHTERMLRSFGHKVETEAGRIRIGAARSLRACELRVPGDISSAAFVLVAASISADADVLVKSVGVNPTRDGVIRILRAMGADIELVNERAYGAEPVADLRVRSAPLQGIAVPPEWVPLAIDEFPVLFVAAACARGRFELRAASELKVKESDRLGGMVRGLRALGVEVEQLPDGLVITGNADKALLGGRVDSLGDHRLAMAFAVASCASSATISIANVGNIQTSFPGFSQLLNQLGAQLSVVPIPGGDT